ncbi:Mam33p [Lachancea thermotolerans CBS 6340]|uniref:KLTH0A04884p n=1 Tax=Lachancea thermotolerans (strain ATCC 56472 / CBS 6340 / NRRL Y-8284) TaxID=559295 RepID=C5DBS0_LACTC|nr:KLTH0A04884p [Lachancea thermotolerans CBS 6340]CAR21227.1 KLTH0A04884p [Lachancea thermotolerans CBS 6340]
MFSRVLVRSAAVAARSARTARCAPMLRSVNLQAASLRPLHFSAVRLNKQCQKVAQVLESEVALEVEEDVQDLPESLQSFFDKTGFSAVASPGKNMAEITSKTARGETVHVFFDVAQVSNLPLESAELDGEAAAPSEEEEFDGMADNFANVNVVVVKDSDQSAVSFELLMNLQEGTFFVDSATPYSSAKAALDETAESEVSRELVYHGPPFSNLDEELQESLEAYLESRGINEELATFIGTYSEFKENKEYINWLKNMKTFFN